MNKLNHKLKHGDILYVNRGLYKHYGIYSGDTTVIHFAPLEGAEINAENAIVHETSLQNFLKGGAPEVDQKSKAKFSRAKVVQRARSQINSNGYSLVFNNCEHFARWCTTGSLESAQVHDAVDIVVDGIISGIDGINGNGNPNDVKRILGKISKFLGK